MWTWNAQCHCSCAQNLLLHVQRKCSCFLCFCFGGGDSSSSSCCCCSSSLSMKSVVGCSTMMKLWSPKSEWDSHSASQSNSTCSCRHIVVECRHRLVSFRAAWCFHQPCLRSKLQRSLSCFCSSNSLLSYSAVWWHVCRFWLVGSLPRRSWSSILSWSDVDGSSTLIWSFCWTRCCRRNRLS